MRAANILAGIAALLWSGLLLMGRISVGSVAAQKVVGFPTAEQIDCAIVFPAAVVITLLLCTCLCNIFRRGLGMLAFLSVMTLVALLPYLALFGGGV